MLLCYGYSNAIQWLDKYTGAAGHAAPFVPHNMQVSGHPGIEQTSAELCETEDCSERSGEERILIRTACASGGGTL